ncbi:phage major capsid protein [Lentzea sp. BCCO 10_0798]|uniref:Phage major capsid protein n=1 Tax=Lentzea kristufekii TaxID=3095430 RepID=A0ABU4TQ63_9PSEU|nr:phage major capsid protein [Lentzea sp. BCCO 10_0798]MDX8050408.1 phage major capsid protein [Lentzea sp. BCCO 10_0798]
MNLVQLIAQLRGQMATKLEQRNGIATQLTELRAADTVDEAKVEELRAQKAGLDAELDQMQARVKELDEEKARDDAADRLSREVNPGAQKPAYDKVARVGAEERTYRKDKDPKGVSFARDVASAFLGDYGAQARLARHSVEEEVERGLAVQGAQERAVGTGAFTGLVVPQYLVDMFAPMATTGRPFADACEHHDLPPTGMTVNLGRGTTGTSVDDQASENAAVSETDYDDTLLQINVRTAAGQQTVSRQGVDRGLQVEDTIIRDLVKRYHAKVDSNLLNLASTGLTNVATAVTYTDASPTVEELYPKIPEGLSGVEAALLDMASGENIAVMHSRRWYWMQNAMTTKWPVISQPNIVEKTLGANYAERYGSGVRGVLPNGTPVIVDNNIATNLGAGTNEDEIYLGDKNEFHLWEDPDAPLLIRAEQTKAASLGVLLVVYGYYAFTHQRYAHARKIAGTGLVTPTFTGV